MSNSKPEEPALPKTDSNPVSPQENLPPARESPADATDESVASVINWSTLKSASAKELSFAGHVDSAESTDGTDTKTIEPVEEIAGDMLELMRQVKTIADVQAQLMARLDEIEKGLHETRQGTATEIVKLRDELIGERKTRLARSTFETVVAVLDSLRTMRAEPNSKKSRRLYSQLTMVELSLGNILQGLGFQEFNAVAGALFDPARMNCIGFDRGPDNVVLKEVHPGYLAGGMVVRLAGVIVGKSQI